MLEPAAAVKNCDEHILQRRALRFYKHFEKRDPSRNVRIVFDRASLAGLEADVLTLFVSLQFELVSPFPRGRNLHQLFFGLTVVRAVSPGGSPFPERRRSLPSSRGVSLHIIHSYEC